MFFLNLGILCSIFPKQMGWEAKGNYKIEDDKVRFILSDGSVNTKAYITFDSAKDTLTQHISEEQKELWEEMVELEMESSAVYKTMLDAYPMEYKRVK